MYREGEGGREGGRERDHRSIGNVYSFWGAGVELFGNYCLNLLTCCTKEGPPLFLSFIVTLFNVLFILSFRSFSTRIDIDTLLMFYSSLKVILLFVDSDFCSSLAILRELSFKLICYQSETYIGLSFHCCRFTFTIRSAQLVQ